MKLTESKFRIFIIILILTIGLSFQPSVAAQDTELAVPERVETEASLSSGPTNDILFQPSPEHSVLPHDIESDETSFSLYRTQEQSRTGLGTFNPFSPFSASGADRVYHASNQSSSDLDLIYSSQYYDLSADQSDQDQLTNLVIPQGEISALRFTVSEIQPLLLDIKYRSPSDTVEVDMQLINPNGERFDYSATHSNQFNAFVNEQIPIIPSETGNYTLFFSPPNTDVIIDSLQILSDVPVETITSGYSDELTGESTVTKLFKLELETNSSEPNIIDIDSQRYISEALEAYQQQGNLLGTVEFAYLSTAGNPFGGQLPVSTVLHEDGQLYVAITVQPPNENNRFIEAEKERLGLDPGFDVEISFWVETFDIPELPVGTDINVGPVEQPNSNYYLYSTDTTKLVGLNATNYSELRLTNLNSSLDSYLLTSNQHDILNTRGDDITEIEAGEYLVYISDLTGGSTNEIRLSEFNTISFDQGQKENYFFNLEQPLFIELSTEQPLKENFNITYLDQRNMSATLEMSLYDSTGNARSTTDYQFHNYASATDPTFNVDNNTVFGNQIMSNHYNVFQGYFRINMIGNTVWNSSLNSPTAIESDLAEPQSEFSIQRENYINTYADTDPTREVHQQSFSELNNEFLNASKSQTVYVFDFASGVNPSGYNIEFTSTNVTYRVLSFVGWTSTWFDETVNTATVEDGIDHYKYQMEFATSTATDFALVVILETGTAVNNGTFSTSMTTLQVQELPGLQVQSLNLVTFASASSVNIEETKGTFGRIISSPWTWVGLGGLAIGGGAVAYYLKTKGAKTPF